MMPVLQAVNRGKSRLRVRIQNCIKKVQTESN